jgi:hypothetical protein
LAETLEERPADELRPTDHDEFREHVSLPSLPAPTASRPTRGDGDAAEEKWTAGSQFRRNEMIHRPRAFLDDLERSESWFRLFRRWDGLLRLAAARRLQGISARSSCPRLPLRFAISMTAVFGAPAPAVTAAGIRSSSAALRRGAIWAGQLDRAAHCRCWSVAKL